LLFVFEIGGIVISGIDTESMSGSILDDIGRENINLLRYILIIQDIALFFVPAVLIRYLLLPDRRSSLTDFRFPRVNEIAIVVLLAFCIFPVTGFAGQLNADMELPEWLSGIEMWMKTKEDEATAVLDLILPSETAGVMFLNVFIIALLPAICEELIFRGVFQRILYGFFKSPHPAIWLTAFLFSAIHLQFYGFIPRFILGLIFGYLFYWGGTLWLPITAHFVNNSVPVIASFLKSGAITDGTTGISLLKQILILPAPLTIIIVILFYFRRRSNKNSET